MPSPWRAISSITAPPRIKCMATPFPSSMGICVSTLYEPLGVVGIIIPWNYPGQIMAARWPQHSPWAMPAW